MRKVVKTFRFTCDAWFYRGGHEWDQTDCPNTLLLNGTKEEIDSLYEQSGWKFSFGEDDRHICPRKHYADSLGVKTPLPQLDTVGIMIDQNLPQGDG